MRIPLAGPGHPGGLQKNRPELAQEDAQSPVDVLLEGRAREAGDQQPEAKAAKGTQNQKGRGLQARCRHGSASVFGMVAEYWMNTELEGSA